MASTHRLRRGLLGLNVPTCCQEVGLYHSLHPDIVSTYSFFVDDISQQQAREILIIGRFQRSSVVEVDGYDTEG